MAKKIVKKRKLKVFNFLIVLLVLTGLFFGVYYLSTIPIKNIVIRKTTYLNDDYILELAELKDYPSFVLTSSRSVEKKLEKSNYINSAHLRKKFGFIVEFEPKLQLLPFVIFVLSFTLFFILSLNFV